MSVRATLRNPAVLSCYALRRAVGIIALSLPFALAGGAILLALVGPAHALPQPILQRSISDYYYTPMRNCLVGSLCTIAAFLICSRGYDRNDEIAGYLSSTFTLGVALFPSVDPRRAEHSRLQIDMGLAHLAFAAMMLLALAYFCLFLFRKSSPEKRPPAASCTETESTAPAALSSSSASSSWSASRSRPRLACFSPLTRSSALNRWRSWPSA
ncbi:MAG: hypothetical protein WBM14_17305 [Terracidiphilus sp.]|jgi:hypothetical protein